MNLRFLTVYKTKRRIGKTDLSKLKLNWLLALTCFFTASAYANPPQLTQFIAGKIQAAQALQQQERYRDAIELLTDLTPRQAYDKAFVQRVLGIFHWQQENTQEAVKYLSLAVDSQLLPKQQAWVTQRMVADILLSQQQYRQALPHYYVLVNDYALIDGVLVNTAVDGDKHDHKNAANGKPKKADIKLNEFTELWLRIAQTHYQLREWDKVLSAVNSYEGLNNQGDQVQALNLQLTAQSQLQRWPAAIDTLDRIIAVEPDKLLWWQQLAGLQLRTSQPAAALTTLILAQRQGLELSAAERRTLAQLYAQQGIPEQAALELAALAKETADNDKRQVLLVEQARYWQMAKEWQYAINTWRDVVSLSEGNTGEYRWPLAQLLLQQGRYEAALLELNHTQIQQHKSSKELAAIELAKVRAYYKLQQYDRAITHAKLAQHIVPSASAKGWLNYLQQVQQINS
ncbi:MAG: bacterial transcriptional activator domain-containing protein [Moritella sp.]|uniref:tetratricopeptide repeat protein n=1 Tax=Moritella sp. TaxID=78556 RepID=UPI0029B534A6|nr:bacterial transcriptional activator domain-containing protein [Moritella sp.]MDX2320128.1 bacterial transcriptional activator domain-containing protein [Moritella sp.]